MVEPGRQTCPKGFWEEWIAEGDAAGDALTNQEYEWHTGSRLISKIGEGDRFYVVGRDVRRSLSLNGNFP